MTDERASDATDGESERQRPDESAAEANADPTSNAESAETERSDGEPSDDEQDDEQFTIADFHDASQEAGRPVLTAASVARALEISQDRAREALESLAERNEVERLSVETDPVVWYPSELEDLTDRERVVVFPKRREIVVDRPDQFTRAQLAQFAHLADGNGEQGYRYVVRPEDVWQAPHDSWETLARTMRQALGQRSEALEEWVESQWERAHQFRLYTHEEGYTVLEAESPEVMGNVARQKLDEEHVHAPISDTEDWVREGSEAAIKRILYEAGYPVQDHRDLEAGEDLTIDLEVSLRDYQRTWVDRFAEAGEGVFVGPPGSGKTVAAMGAMAHVGGETLILVPSRDLARQWADAIAEYTSLEPRHIGQYHGGRKEVRPVTIATYQIAGMDRHRSLFDDREWGLVIFDECQHVPSDVYRRSTHLQSKHRLGLSVDGDTVVPIKRNGNVSMERIADLATEHLGEETGWSRVNDAKTLAVTDGGDVNWTDITGVVRHRNTKPMYEIRSSNGRKVSVTGDHSIIVFDAEEMELTSKLPTEIDVTDYLLQPHDPDLGLPSRSTVDILSLLDEGFVLLNEDTPDSEFEPLYERDIGDNKRRYNWKTRGNLPLSVAREIDIDREYIKGVYTGKRTQYIPPSVPIEDFARLVGLFVADGCLDHRRVEFYAQDTAETSEVGEFKSIIRSLHPKGNITTSSNGSGCTTVRISGPLVDILETVGLSNGAREKTIPPIILSNPQSYEPFLEGVILGDGSRQRRDRNRANVTISTSSERLTHGLNIILSSLGYVGGNYRRACDVEVREQTHDVTTNNLVRFNPKNREKDPRNSLVPFTEQLRDCYDAIGRVPVTKRYDGIQETPLQSGLEHRTRLNDRELVTLLDRTDTDQWRWLAETDIAMLEVDSIERVEDEEFVYDISTAESNFLGNSLFCHNSASPIREDDRQQEIFTLVGPPIGTDWEALFDAGFVAEPELEIRYVPWGDEEQRNAYVSAEGQEKYRIAAKNRGKVDEVRYLLSAHPDSKALVFVDYLEQGRDLAAALDVPFLSGETPHHERRRLLDEFRRNERDLLIISRVGDEGIDLPTADLAIVASGLGGSRRQGTQRAGRTMRPAGGALVYVLATRGTREEDFARKQLQHLGRKGMSVRERTVERDESEDGDARDGDSTDGEAEANDGGSAE